MKKEISEIENITATKIFLVGPALILSITISGDGANGDCDIYDGVNDKGRKILHLEILSGSSFQKTFVKPKRVDRGLYVVINASTTNVAIEYQTE